VLTREVQRDIVKRTIIHVDFLEVDKTTRITYEVPIHVVGESPAVLAKLGMVTMNANTLTVESLASNLLERIDVDISGLKHTGDTVTIGDLKLGEGMKIEGPLDEVVLRIAPFATTTAEEEAVGEEAVSAEPEVIKKGKVEEEGIED
jgi:large subunit ribosomal protein L25